MAIEMERAVKTTDTTTTKDRPAGDISDSTKTNPEAGGAESPKREQK